MSYEFRTACCQSHTLAALCSTCRAAYRAGAAAGIPEPVGLVAAIQQPRSPAALHTNAGSGVPAPPDMVTLIQQETHHA